MNDLLCLQAIGPPIAVNLIQLIKLITIVITKNGEHITVIMTSTYTGFFQLLNCENIDATKYQLSLITYVFI